MTGLGQSMLEMGRKRHIHVTSDFPRMIYDLADRTKVS